MWFINLVVQECMYLSLGSVRKPLNNNNKNNYETQDNKASLSWCYLKVYYDDALQSQQPESIPHDTPSLH